MKKEKVTIVFLLTLSSFIFFIFGFFHLAKFETTDEHLWKYGRIKQYWTSIKKMDFEKTYINDKPGVTVALISGVGLLSYPNPEKAQISSEKMPLEPPGLFEKYNTENSEKINFSFRFPILIFGLISIFIFFWISLSAFNSIWISIFTTIFIAINPVLIGMSQIINPDSFFWAFGGLSIISYLAFKNKSKRKFLILCGIFTGFSLLSKYTAFMLFLFYFIHSFSKIIFEKNEEKDYLKIIYKNIFEIISIFLISISIFSIFLPAVFLHPEYLFKGISQFLNIKIFLSLALLISLIIIFINYTKKYVQKSILFLKKYNELIFKLFFSIFILIFLISFLNVITSQKFIPVDLLRDAAYANEPKEFNFKPLIDKATPALKKNVQLFFMEIYPFIFSLSPILILLLFLSFIKTFKTKKITNATPLIFSILLFSFLYFISTIFAKIVTNIRYSIMLYPIFAMLGAISIVETAKTFKIKNENRYFFIIAIIIISISTLSIYKIRPFYFSYANFLLPNEFSINDSWGHGSYEAAQHLNNIPNSENLIIWSNSDTVCRFFKGKCLRSRKIDLNKTSPDYFVISKRGELKLSNRFILNNNKEKDKDSDYYFKKLKNDYAWQILIDNRPDNFIKIIKFEK